MNLEKLKETARRFEQKEEWRKAIEVYLKAIQEVETGRDSHPDLAVYNRLGDLYLKTNDTNAAIRAYERAADLYGEQGFFNNAIALCGKILRINPGRVQVYLKLAYLHARKNVIIEAKRNLLAYIERMHAAGQLDEAFAAVKAYADEFSSNQELRLMLVELLRAASRDNEAREELAKVAVSLEARGDEAGADATRAQLVEIAIDFDEPLDVSEHPDARVRAPVMPSAPAAPAPRSGDLIFLDVGVDAEPSAAPGARKAAERPDVVPLEGIESTAAEAPELEAAPVLLEGLQGTVEESAGGAQASGEALDLDSAAQDRAAAEALPLEGLEPTRYELEELDVSEPLPETDLEPVAELESGAELEAEFTLDTAEVQTVEGLELLPDEVEEAPAELEEPALAGAAADAEAELRAALEEEVGAEAAVEVEFIEVEATEGEATDDEAAAIVEALDAQAVEPPSLEPVPPPETVRTLVEELEDRVAEQPDDPALHRRLGEALLESGDGHRAAEEFALALREFEADEQWDQASYLADRLVELKPDNIRFYQKRVEIAFRMQDRPRLVEAYLALGDALVRADAMDKALAVYQRVLDHDPDNALATQAISTYAPPPPHEPAVPAPPVTGPPATPRAPARPMPEDVRRPEPPPPRVAMPEDARPAPPEPVAPAAAAAAARDERDPSFVDLGSMIFTAPALRDTRMTTKIQAPTGDEQKDFEEQLAAFKRGIEENIDAEDYQSHYDLGVAFKEMGLLDEAIAEFQKALRAPDGRLRTSEALGTAFFEKGQFAIAEAVLRRAVDGIKGPEEEKIGLIYWLGRAAEAQERPVDALTWYERALGVDIRFKDVNDRIQRLTAGRQG